MPNPHIQGMEPPAHGPNHSGQLDIPDYVATFVCLLYAARLVASSNNRTFSSVVSFSPPKMYSNTPFLSMT